MNVKSFGEANDGVERWIDLGICSSLDLGIF